MILKLLHEVLKFVDIYVSWSSPKTDQEINGESKFWEHQFFSVETIWLHI